MTNLNKIILKPVFTESSLLGHETGKYAFWVAVTADKNSVASAFTAYFGIRPLAVNILNVKGKSKFTWKSRKPYTKINRKKAVITIKKDQKIDLLLKDKKKK